MPEKEDKNQAGIFIRRDKQREHTDCQIHDKRPVRGCCFRHDQDEQAAQHRHNEIKHRQNAGNKQKQQTERSERSAEGNAVGKWLLTHTETSYEMCRNCAECKKMKLVLVIIL